MSDRYGRKFILLTSFVGSGISYLLLGATTTVSMLFLSRLIVGVVKQTMVTTIPTLIEDIADCIKGLAH
jgi:MFS family permease